MAAGRSRNEVYKAKLNLTRLLNGDE